MHFLYLTMYNDFAFQMYYNYNAFVIIVCYFSVTIFATETVDSRAIKTVNFIILFDSQIV